MSDDLISRSALLECIKKEKSNLVIHGMNNSPANVWFVSGLRWCVEAVKKAPAVDAVLVVHGMRERAVEGAGPYKEAEE